MVFMLLAPRSPPKADEAVVPGTGVEPACPRGRYHLKVVSLPFLHPGTFQICLSIIAKLLSKNKGESLQLFTFFDDGLVARPIYWAAADKSARYI